MPRAVVVALLILFAVSGAGAGAAQPSAPGSATTTAAPAGAVEVLSLDAPTRSTVTNQSLDVAAAVATQRGAATGRLDRYALAAAFEQAGDDQARRELLFEAATDVEISISELRAEQRALRTGYLDGSIAPGAFLRRQAVIHARADQLTDRLVEIQSFADRVPRLTMRSRLQALEASLSGLDGPVTNRLVAAIDGSEPRLRLYVAASANGSAMSMLEGTQYVRESFRSDFWRPDSTTGLGLDAVEARAGELYPVAFNSSQTRSRGIEIVDAGIYRIDIGYDQGTVVAYLDGDTQQVFYEVQRQPLDAIHPGPAVSTTSGGVRVHVNRTYAGGPLRIAVVDAIDGAPLEATVSVGETRITTGPDGTAWALMPAGEVEVTATTTAGEATVTVGPAS